MTLTSKPNSPRGRLRLSWAHPDYWDSPGLNPTETVYETLEESHSQLLGPDGEPIPYQSRKLGFVGFFKLKELP